MRPSKRRAASAIAPANLLPTNTSTSGVGLAGTEPMGVSGTANFGGQLRVEENPKLRQTLGYGRAGTESWGEWERLRRTNPFVAAGLGFVSGPIRGAGLSVEAADAPDGQLHADFVQEQLEQLEPGFGDLRAAIVEGMLATGFSLWEWVLPVGRSTVLPGGTGYAGLRLLERLPQSLAPNPWHEKDGELFEVEQQAPDNGGEGKWRMVRIPAERLLLFSWQRQGNNYSGFSAFRPVWYLCQVQAELLRLIGISYQREGAGVPVMEADSKDGAEPLTKDQRDEAQRILANLVYHEHASLVPPAGWKLNWVFSGGADKGHILEAWKGMGVHILQQVQAQQLVLGTSNTGSRSVGEVHDAQAMAYLHGVTSAVEDVLNGRGRPYVGLGRRLIDANFGPQTAYPKIRLILKRQQLGPVERLNAMATAISSGLLTVTPEDENEIREELGLEARVEAVPVEPTEAPATVAGPPSVPPAPAESGEETEGGGEKIQLARARRARAPKGKWKPWRPLRASEAALDLPSLDASLSHFRDDWEAGVRPLVVAMLAKAAPAITAAMADGDPSEVASLPLDTSEIERYLDGFLARVKDAGSLATQQELTQRSGLEASGGPATVAGPRLRAATGRDILESIKESLLRRLTGRLRGELESQAVDAIRTGDDASAVVRRAIVSQLDTGSFRSDAGTVITRVFNVGREEAAEMLGGVDEVEYTAILDSATCSPCMRMDGRRAPFGSDAHESMVPPNRDCEGGANCRCLLVYIPKK